MKTTHIAITLCMLILAGCSSAPQKSSRLIGCDPYCYLYVNHPEPACMEILPDGVIAECKKQPVATRADQG